MNHASLNIANALGAWLGGLVIAAGLRLPVDRRSWASALSVAGFLVVIASAMVHARGASSSASRS